MLKAQYSNTPVLQRSNLLVIYDPTNSIVFLVDVDNTLLDNDRVQDDIKRHLEREFGAAYRNRYWTILEQLFAEPGYRDYLGAFEPDRVAAAAKELFGK